MVSFSSFPSGPGLHLLLALFLFASRLPVAAQAPTWQAARAVAAATSAASNDYSEVRATAVDAAGNVYLAGNFTNTMVLGGTSLVSRGGHDVFVAKFNPTSNQFVWAQRAGGSGTDQAYALAVSGTSVYVAGTFDSFTIAFGSTTLTNALPGPGPITSLDAFVAKLTDAGPTGSFAWAQRAGGTGDDQAFALAVSGTSVYVAGGFASPTAGFGNTALANAGSYDAFVAKLVDAGPAGGFVWAQRAGGAGEEAARALAVSGAVVYVAGYFSSFGAGFGSTFLSSAGSFDAFVAKLADAGATGTFAWAQRAGGSAFDYGSAVVASGTSVYVAGTFSATAGFGPTTLISDGITDAFVAKLTDAGPAGSFAWAERAGGAGSDYPGALAVSGTSVYVAGAFDGPTADFGAVRLPNARAGFYDVFVSKLTDAGASGNFAWAQRAGGTGLDVASALVVSGTGVYVAGYFGSSTANFGTVTLSNPNFNPNSNTLGFLATLTDPTLTATAAAGPRAPAALFPNPARHTATLRLPAGAAPAPLVLMDAQGRVVRRYPAPASPEAVLDLKGLPAGLYLLLGAGPTQRLEVE